MATASQVVAGMKQFDLEVREGLTNAYRSIVVDLFTLVSDGTPVDTGMARGGWNVNITAAGIRGTSPINRFIISGPAQIELAKTALLNFNPSFITIISNDIEYVEYLDQGTNRLPPLQIVQNAINTVVNRYGI